ncbi:formylglycine-generating enzyme family protein [Cribrihabitans sp. XS_ASV171]
MKSVALLSVLVVSGGLGWMVLPEAPPPFVPPETVEIAAGEVAWRPLGSFALDGKSRTPREMPVRVEGFSIMKYQVSRAQYAVCVSEGACEPVAAVGGHLPQTQVNWADATAFARWYSDRTGEVWRLPSEAEWRRAAAERYGDAAPDPEARDPGERMLAQYRSGTLLRGIASPSLRPAGGFGVNSMGVADISGNVWEWTTDCMENGTLNADGTIAESEPYCWVRVAGGIHRAAIVDFVRDASVGGCAVGLPPDHLGFRLVREVPRARDRFF